MAIPTEFDRSRLYKKKRRIVRAFLLLWIIIRYDAAGSTLGAEMWKPHCGRPQTCAKESLTLWTLFILGHGVGTLYAGKPCAEMQVLRYALSCTLKAWKPLPTSCVSPMNSTRAVAPKGTVTCRCVPP